MQVGVHSSPVPSSSRPPKHHAGGSDVASSSTVILFVARCLRARQSASGGDSGGDGGGVGFSCRRHLLTCSSNVGEEGDCSAAADKAICSANVLPAVLPPGVVDSETASGAGGGTTEIGDSFFHRDTRRGLMCLLLIRAGC